MAISAISCLDTRYLEDVKPLIGVFDEFAYYRNRIHVEIEYFQYFTCIQIGYDAIRDFKQSDFQKILEHTLICRNQLKLFLITNVLLLFWIK